MRVVGWHVDHLSGHFHVKVRRDLALVVYIITSVAIVTVPKLKHVFTKLSLVFERSVPRSKFFSAMRILTLGTISDQGRSG